MKLINGGILIKITLINPIFQKKIYSPLPRIIERSRGRFPPLGLAYIASFLEQYGYKVNIIDQDVHQFSKKQIEEILNRQKPDIVGITCTSFTFLQAKKVAELIKKIFPNVKILVGGPHLSIYPKEVLSNICFDIGVIGEGEITTLELIKAIERNLSLDNIQGIVFKKDNKIKINELRPFVSNLDELPFPAVHLLSINKYFDAFSKIKPFFTMITSRGCPFNCTFCLRSTGIHFGNKYRARSPENVIEEIEFLINKYKVREIFFYDDTFTVNQRRIYEICRQIIKNKLNISWSCRTRIDLVTPNLLKIMKLAGCQRIHYGIESGDQHILDCLKKEITIDQVKRTINWTKMADIKILAYFMLGSPKESIGSIKKTIQFANFLNPSYVGFYITTLFPGTELYDSALREGIIKNDIWKEFTLGNLNEQPHPIFQTKIITSEFLKRTIKYAYLKFYLRNKYILQNIKSIKSLKQLLINLNNFLILLKI